MMGRSCVGGDAEVRCRKTVCRGMGILQDKERQEKLEIRQRKWIANMTVRKRREDYS